MDETRWIEPSQTNQEKPEQVDELRRGTIVGTDYRLLDFIGRGGMGVVYTAEHRLIPGMIYAIKILDAKAVSEQSIKRFHREAMALARLSHQDIVRIYNFGNDDAVGLYLVMEYIKGASLADRIKQQGPFTEEMALELFKSVARALACPPPGHHP